MLFNSYEFIFLFLPVIAMGFFRLEGRGRLRTTAAWLVGASLIFYGWWNPIYLWLIVFSLLFNYSVGTYLIRRTAAQGKRAALWMGIGCNVGLLGYFKYAQFITDNFNSALGTTIYLDTIVLPLAISFFTFQQIAYLVDAYQGKAQEQSFLHYSLFVTFFPQLIAGPIVHHKEMMPQFGGWRSADKRGEDLAVGISIFVLGLFKKVVLADGVAPFANVVFDNASVGHAPTFTQAWTGSFAYGFQLYFDFSGYSDMAVGAARMFGIRLPINFLSPYKATNIIDFWRRWHITLSRFLRDYLYIPLGGNRKGKFRRYVNLLVTMLLGGLWHGAGWTFVFWGLLHGLYVVANHAWRELRRRLGHDLSRSTLSGRLVGRGLTFLAVLIGWVFFRATDFDSALVILSSMAGARGHWLGDLNPAALAWLASLGAITWVMPSSYLFMRNHSPVLEVERLREHTVFDATWAPNAKWGLAVGLLALVSVLRLSRVSEFLYFQF